MNPEDFEQFIPLLSQMLRTKQHLTTAPTFVPRNSFEQWQMYDDEDPVTPVRRLYFYVNGDWRYTTLT